jgi:hypothetical protein
MALGHGPTVVTQGLVLALDAADRNSYPGSGTTWTDLSGNGNNGSLENGVGYTSSNGGSLSFDGTDDYVDIGNCTDFFPSGSQSHNISISLWVKLPDTSNNIVFGQQNVGNERLYISTYDGNWDVGWGQYSWSSTGASGTFINSSTNWTNLVMRVSNGVATLYVNSIESISKTDTSVNLQGKLPIGVYFYLNSIDSPNSNPNNISVAQIYNRALTASEIQQNFKALRTRYGI